MYFYNKTASNSRNIYYSIVGQLESPFTGGKNELLFFLPLFFISRIWLLNKDESLGKKGLFKKPSASFPLHLKGLYIYFFPSFNFSKEKIDIFLSLTFQDEITSLPFFQKKISYYYKYSKKPDGKNKGQCSGFVMHAQVSTWQCIMALHAQVSAYRPPVFFSSPNVKK